MVDLDQDVFGLLAERRVAAPQSGDKVVQAAHISELHERLGGLQAALGLPLAVHELEQGFAIAERAQPPDLLSAVLFLVASAAIRRSVIEQGDLPFGSKLRIRY